MSQITVEERLAKLEKQVSQIAAAMQPHKPGKYDWISTIGMFGDDEVMKEIDALALEYREEDRERSRKEYAVEQG